MHALYTMDPAAVLAIGFASGWFSLFVFAKVSRPRNPQA